MMGVAGRSHRQTADLRVFESVTVVTTECGCRIENFDGIDGQRLKNAQPDSSAEQIREVKRNSESAALLSDIARFTRGCASQIGQAGDHPTTVPCRRSNFVYR